MPIGTQWRWAPTIVIAAALPLLAAHAQSGATPAPIVLPEGPGKAQLVADCAGCHAPTVVASERHTADEWSAIVAVMVDRGAQLSDADNAAITAYLATNYGKAPTPAAH